MKRMRLNIKSIPSILFLFIVFWVGFTILALTWGLVFDWPDYYHVNYGFPFMWATHTLNTIAGPVDIWHVNLQALVFNLCLLYTSDAADE